MNEIKTDQQDILRVDTEGAKLTLTLHGISILGTFTRGDGKTGTTHPCTPVLGPDRKSLFGLKQHGNMRNQTVDVKQIVDNIVVTHTITDSGYPEGVLVKQIMGIEDGMFSFVMMHTNNGMTKAPINVGEHCYFDAPQSYKGTIINGQDVTQLIEDNWNGIAIDLNETNSIRIPGKPEIELIQNGFYKAMLWVGKNPETKEMDSTYICIEPVEENPAGEFFGSKGSRLLPGQSRSVMFSLLIKD